MAPTVNGGGSRTAATSKVELFAIVVNGSKSLIIITKSFTLNAAVAVDPSLVYSSVNGVISIFGRVSMLTRKAQFYKTLAMAQHFFETLFRITVRCIFHLRCSSMKACKNDSLYS